MNGRFLRASINQIELGRLQEVAGLWSFQYAADWLEHPRCFALSPQLPLTAELLLDGASRRPVQWYFDNLLPEEGQRVLLPAMPDWTRQMPLVCWPATARSQPAP